MFGMYYGSKGLETTPTPDGVEKLKKVLNDADTLVIGAGAGLSTAAGYTYGGDRFYKYFRDFYEKYGIRDMYSGGFYPYPTPEERFAWWSRHIYVNRYAPVPSPLYDELYALVKDREYFVITTNVDHCFQRAGFDKARLFYTQGDYGLWQCPKPCHRKTYDNEADVRAMILDQGFAIGEGGELITPMDESGGTDFSRLKMTVPTELIPRCPVCGELMTTNLRADDAFVEDEGWNTAASSYERFLRRNERSRMLYLELGVGGNTPVIIKYPFWRMTRDNKRAVFACVGHSAAICPKEIADRSILIQGDIRNVIERLSAETQCEEDSGVYPDTTEKG